MITNSMRYNIIKKIDFKRWPSLVLDTEYINFQWSTGHTFGTFTISYEGDGIVTAVASKPNLFDVSIDGNKINVRMLDSGGGNGTVTITISISETETYKGESKDGVIIYE